MGYHVDRIKALQSLPVSSAVLDSTGEILAVNEGWKEYGRRNGLKLPAFGVGQNYLDHCGDEFRQDLRKLLAGELDILTQVYPCNMTEDDRWFFMLCMPLSLQQPRQVAVVHANLTALLPLPMIEVGVVAAGVEGAIEAALTTKLQSMWAPLRVHAALAHLTSRQKEVLRLVGEGKSNKEIARAIGRSDQTVKAHVSEILRRLKVKNRAEAVFLASKLRSSAKSVPPDFRDQRWFHQSAITANRYLPKCDGS